MPLLPRTALAVLPATHTGVTVAFTASDQVNGTLFANDGRTILVVHNGSGAPLVVTVIATLVVDMNLQVPNRVVTVPNGANIILGTFPQDVYGQADGSIWVDCSAPAGLLALSVP